MKVNVLFFGATADAVGSREIEYRSSEDLTVSALTSGLMKRYPELSNRRLLIAVNEEFAEPDTALVESDEVAVFTPVSGG